MAINKQTFSFSNLRKLVAIVVITCTLLLPRITTASSITAPRHLPPEKIQFCPKGKSYGDSSCSPKQAYLEDAIQDAKDAAITGVSGTIYLEGGTYSADSGDATGSPIYISGFNYGTSLTVQGAVLGGTTTFVRTLSVGTNDDLDFTLMDVTASASDGSLTERVIHVNNNTGNFLFQNVQIVNNHNLGFYVANLDGDITLKQVTANSNNPGNISFASITGSLIMEDVEASSTGSGAGVLLQNIYGAKGVKISNITAQNNQGNNISINGITGDVTLENGTVSGSVTGLGMYFEQIHGKKGVTIKNATSNSNSFSNIYIATIDGGVSLMEMGWLSLE
jgi:hypothetical protein